MNQVAYDGCRRIILCLTVLALCVAASSAMADDVQATWPTKTHYRYAEINGRRIFYREAGDPNSPTILLLHGYPSSSHTYRELIPLLSGRFHVIAPDNLGSGYSDHPDPDKTIYTFDLLADHVSGLIDHLKIDQYVLYMQDFGAPVGYRVMLKDPKRVRGIIAQNANAYLEGMTDQKQAFFRNAQEDRSPEHVASLYKHVSDEAIKYKQYLRDVPDDRRDTMSPDTWTHDLAFLRTGSDRKIQVQLFQDYYSNLLAYPKWQAFLRKNKPPTLLVWGKNDPVFMASGAEAYLRDVPDAKLHLIDAGHFAVEERPVVIAQHIVRFMESDLK